MGNTHTFTAESLSAEEIRVRHEKCRQQLESHDDSVGGMLIFSRTNIYYLTGTRANGILWLPRQGEPVLMVRKGEERCRLESPLKHIVSFKSYSSLPNICAEFASPFTPCIGAEMRALPWSLASMLETRLKEYDFVDISQSLEKARFLKTPYELKRLRQSSHLQQYALTQLFPQLLPQLFSQLLPHTLRVDMTEQDVAHMLWKLYFSLGHGGMLRYDMPCDARCGSALQETFLGNIAAGRNSLCPNAFGDVTGTLGTHAAMPFMGSSHTIWEKHQNLMMDTGFIHEGYHSHMAFTYFNGTASHIPASLQKAYDTCLDLLAQCQQKIHTGMTMAELIRTFASAKNQGYSWSVNGIGLSLREYPYASSCSQPSQRAAQEVLCQNGAVLCLACMVPVNSDSHNASDTDGGLVGIRTVFEIINGNMVCLGNRTQNILCTSI